jgi:Tubulin/FtsZ family, GTPase domain
LVCAGGKAVNNMIVSGFSGVDFVAANTDAQALTSSRAERIILMGLQVTEGLGAGSKREVGKAAAEEALEEIRDHLASPHMVFLTASAGGALARVRLGSSPQPPVTWASSRSVITEPFRFESGRRMRIAEDGTQASCRPHRSGPCERLPAQFRSTLQGLRLRTSRPRDLRAAAGDTGRPSRCIDIVVRRTGGGDDSRARDSTTASACRARNPFLSASGQTKRQLATLITPPKRFAIERSHPIAPPPLTDQAKRTSKGRQQRRCFPNPCGGL